MMHIHTLYQWQNQMIVMLKHTDRTVCSDGVLQHLQEGPSRQLAQGEEDREISLLPQKGQQSQNIQWPFCQRTIIFEESILNA
jgi:hypothetical protein